MLRNACLLGLCLLLSACTPGKQSADMWEDYLSRLERVLETDIKPGAVRISHYPSRKTLRQAPKDLSIGIFDFLSILECDLNRVIATRNSVLGKVMQSSQQWLYEVNLINALDECIYILTGQDEPPDVLQDLQTIVAVKRADLPVAVWNAIFAGPEFQQFMSTRKGTLETDFQFAYYANLTSSLAQLARWAGNPMLPGVSAEYEQVNQQLVTYPIYGQLMLSILEAAVMLDSVSATLRLKMASRPICLSPKPTPKAGIMRNILVNIYTTRVQPYIAELNKAHTAWHALLAGAAKELPKESLGSYYSLNLTQSPLSIHGRFKKASVEHARVWTELLEHCGMRPGNA